MRLSRTYFMVLICSLCCLALISEAAEPPPIQLPVSFDKVWYRPGSRGGFGGAKETGFLTIGKEGIEFAAKKSAQVWSWDKIENASYGRMRGDIDTDWVVLGLTDAGGERITVGFRDGQKLGYGQSTVRLFETIISALRQNEAGPWAVPSGFQLFDDLYKQFTIAYPIGWQPHHENMTALDGKPIWGRSWFGGQPWAELRSDAVLQAKAIKQLERGQAQGLLLDRLAAPKGLRCDADEEKAVKRLLPMIEERLDPLRWSIAPQVETVRLDGCNAWSFVGTAATSNGDPGEVRITAISDGLSVYLMQSRGDLDATEIEIFETFVNSIRIAVAR
jgi:hypothetical protein